MFMNLIGSLFIMREEDFLEIWTRNFRDFRASYKSVSFKKKANKQWGQLKWLSS